MPEQARVSDICKCDACAHGCPVCPHPVQGPIMQGASITFVNKLPAGREKDPGMHMICCNQNKFEIVSGSGTVFIEGKAAARKGDPTKHCGGSGEVNMGSGDVFTGD